MIKRLLGLTILLFLLFSLTACGQGLAAYKEDAKQQIESYANAKGEDNYSMDGWAAIFNAVTQCKIDIDAAAKKSAVDTAVKTATGAIAEVLHEDKIGVFYSLQKAYDDGLLTVDDLRSIAYYQSGGKDEPNFVPIPKSPENLNDETENAIKGTYMAVLRAQTHLNGTPIFPYAKIDDITILGYYGAYRGAIAIKICDSYSDYPAIVKTLEIAGITFTYSGAVVTIWKAN